MPHVYVLVDSSLPHPHLTVQAAHAAVAASRVYDQGVEDPHPNLVICGVAGEQALEAAFNKLKEQGVPAVAWREEDMGNALTAVATGPLRGAERKPLRRFKLLPPG